MEDNTPTIQEVLDQHFPGFIAEEVVLPSGEKIDLEEKPNADDREG